MAANEGIKICDICHKSDNEPLDLGEFMEKGGVTVHYYCLLLSTNLEQNGKDSGGILGFLKKDIKREIRNIQEKFCYYCKEPRASIHCAKCSKIFHLICGLRNNCQNQFIDTFTSFCHEHHTIRHPKKHDSNEGCFICLNAIGEYNPLTSVMAKCCSCGWAHRRCVKQFALSAGYYLKCIWCASEQFRNQVRLEGIFVPDRDAEWEKEKGAYGDFYVGHSTCNILRCICPQGRSYHMKKGKWKVLVCNGCRAYGEHVECSKRKEGEDFLCSLCAKVLRKTSVVHNNNNSQLDVSLFMTKSQRTFNQTLDPLDDLHLLPADSSTYSNQIKSSDLEEAIQKEDIKYVKEIYVVFDKNSGEIVGSLDAKRKYLLNNKDELCAEDLEFSVDDFHPYLVRPSDKGLSIIDKVLQEIVQQTVIAPKFKIELSDED